MEVGGGFRVEGFGFRVQGLGFRGNPALESCAFSLSVEPEADSFQFSSTPQRLPPTSSRFQRRIILDPQP